jgi:hypothetical protein
MTSPRQLLAFIGAGLVGIGVETFRYPPSVLALSWLWASLAGLAGLTCIAAAARPRKLYVAASGAAVVTCCVARAFALTVQWTHADSDAEAGYIVLAITWLILAACVLIVWREYITPWAVGRQAAGLTRRARADREAAT